MVRPLEVIGSTEMPCSSMRNGYSFVPWAEPRYLTTRRRRVEICSWTRWSSRMTQSETYSSRPWRVSVPSPRSPVMMAVTPLSLSQLEQPAQFGAQDRLVRQAAEQRLDGVQRRPAWRRSSRWQIRAG